MKTRKYKKELNGKNKWKLPDRKTLFGSLMGTVNYSGFDMDCFAAI